VEKVIEIKRLFLHLLLPQNVCRKIINRNLLIL
jgi:hypothetical protein